MEEDWPIFSRTWWLEAVAPGQWGAAQVEQGGQIVARLPYVRQNKFGIRILASAPLTPYLGPWFRDTGAKYSNQLGLQKDLLYELIDKLPRFHFFRQNLHHQAMNSLPFYWRGFELSLSYTYLLDELKDLDAVWEEMSKTTRNTIRKAQKMLTVRTDLGLEKFLDLNEMTFRRQGLPLPYSRDLVKRIDAACEQRDMRRIFFAEDAQGRLHGAVYVVWDRTHVYYLMSGSDPDLRSSGVGELLLWEAIQFAAKTGKKFDFEGSMIEAVEKFIRNFGARQVPYPTIRRFSSPVIKIGLQMAKMFRRSNSK